MQQSLSSNSLTNRCRLISVTLLMAFGFMVLLTEFIILPNNSWLFCKAKNCTRMKPKTNVGLVVEKEIKFVAFLIDDARRLGNQIFNLAAIVYTGKLSGRTPVMQKNTHWRSAPYLNRTFLLTSMRVSDDLCPCYSFTENIPLGYDSRVEVIGRKPHESEKEKTIILHGFYQSWKYTRTVEKKLKKLLQFKPDIKRFAMNFLSSSRPSGWPVNSFIRVAIHIRRGDVLEGQFQDHGFTVADEHYYRRAMGYFVSRYKRVQFIALSEDKSWTQTNIICTTNGKINVKPDYCDNFENVTGNVSGNNVNITYALDHSPEQDLAIMAMSDHVIMSTGTFGWWGAWLANGITIYYKNWPRSDSKLSKDFRREDFFPPRWIAM